MKKPSVFSAVLTRSLTLGAAALYALPASAEEGAAKAGLPQLDATLFPEQLFWLAISFSTLYLLMKYVALPGVESVQGKRKHVIDTELNTAKAANEQAKTVGRDAEKALADARAKANATVTTIKSEASQLAYEQQVEQSKRINKRLREVEDGIAATRDKALKEIEATVGDLAAAIVENVSSLKVKA
jgi:F-type H+-transporting ATPase subunit b